MAIEDIKTPKSLTLPSIEQIEDEKIKDVLKKLLDSIDTTHKKHYEDIKKLHRILAGTDAMQNALNMGSNLINNVTDPVANQDAATKKYHDDNIPDLTGYMLYANTRFEVGTFTRDLTAASGTQEIDLTAAFEPGGVILFATIGGTTVWSNGVADGSNNYCTYANHAGNMSSSAYALRLYSGAGASQVGSVAFDSDGFTVTWTKVNAPVGTATIQFIAFR